MEGAHFVAIPSHGLEGGIVITQLSFSAQEVLLLKDGQPRVTVVLHTQGTGSDHRCTVGNQEPAAHPGPPLLPDQSFLQTARKGNKATGTRNLTRGIPFALPRNLHKNNHRTNVSLGDNRRKEGRKEKEGKKEKKKTQPECPTTGTRR